MIIGRGIRTQKETEHNVGRKGVLWATGGLLLLSASLTQADFAVEEKEINPSPYGQGQTVHFRKAIQGGEPMSIEEEAAVMRELPESLTNRYYVRGGLNMGKLSLARFSKKSGDSGVALSNQKWSVKQKGGIELAVGYAMSDFRTELEGLFHKNLKFHAPNFSAGQTLSATLKSQTVLLNGYYDWMDWDPVLPYVMGSVGVSVNKVQSSLPGQSTTSGKTKFGLAYGAGIGLRTRLVSRFMLDVGVRYNFLGPVELRPEAGGVFKSKLKLPAFRAGLIFLF